MVSETYRCWVTERAPAPASAASRVFIIYGDDDDRTSATVLPRGSSPHPPSTNKLRDKAINYKDRTLCLLNRTLRQQEAFSGGGEVLRASCEPATSMFRYCTIVSQTGKSSVNWEKSISESNDLDCWSSTKGNLGRIGSDRPGATTRLRRYPGLSRVHPPPRRHRGWRILL